MHCDARHSSVSSRNGDGFSASYLYRAHRYTACMYILCALAQDTARHCGILDFDADDASLYHDDINYTAIDRSQQMTITSR